MVATNDDILRGIETTNNLLMNFLGTVSGGLITTVAVSGGIHHIIQLTIMMLL